MEVSVTSHRKQHAEPAFQVKLLTKFSTSIETLGRELRSTGLGASTDRYRCCLVDSDLMIYCRVSLESSLEHL